MTSKLNNNQPYSHDHSDDSNQNLSDEECASLRKQCDEVTKENTQLKEEVLSLRKTIQELEDWGGEFSSGGSDTTSSLQSTIDSLTSRNRQVENELQRLQLQQRNNQLALERLDEYEETISQLQDELDRERSNKKKCQTDKDGDVNHHLLIEERKRVEELSLHLEAARRESEEKNLQIENERVTLQNFKHDQLEEQENLRTMHDRQLTELNNQLDELRQQLQSRETQIQSFQSSTATPGSPPMMSSSTHDRQSEDDKQQLTSIYEQLLALLPGEYSLSDNVTLSLVERFTNLFEQFSSYFGALSIVQEELDSLKQILIEKQDELEKLRTHFEEQQTVAKKTHFYESDDDGEQELEEILDFHQRAASVTPGEKQQLIAQNELLSTLLTEKEQELIFLQQTEKTREEFMENLRSSLQKAETEKEMKQVELNDIRNVLDEKLRENSSLKKEKMYFIEKLAEFERERQEIIHIAPKQTSPAPIATQGTTQEQYNELLELSQRQHEESVAYYNEYTRIVTLYNELNTKYSQLQIDYESIQTLIQQKNEAYLQCQNELNTFQNLLYHQKKRSDDNDLLTAKLNEREQQLQEMVAREKEFVRRQEELELSVKVLEENSLRWKSNQQLFDQIQIDLKRTAHERDLAIVEKKQLENEIQVNREKLLNSTIARLTNENNEIRQYLESANEVLKTKDILISELQSDIDAKTQQIIVCQENFQSTNSTRVEKQLVKNILLSYFQTPIDKQQEVIPILSALVGFTQDEYDKAMNAISNNYANSTSSGWLSSWLGGGYPVRSKPSSSIQPDKSFAELLIQYVDQESTTTLNPDVPNMKSSTDEQSSTQQNTSPSTQSSSINTDKLLTI